MALLVDPPDIKREMQMEMHHLLRRRHRRRRGRRIGRWTGARSILHRRPYISLVCVWTGMRTVCYFDGKTQRSTMGKDVLENESFCLKTIGYKKLASGFVKAFVNHLNH
ncbi:uncharacterized protein [Zea mays]|uniref:uncharacterized protein isoform X2 n=1 Tax=Zea mays TaxID=4577 RepID=UPI0001BA88C0|nr:uncharacterized protein LOC100278030 isoform X2 [Zea mays]|eukprot:XP_020405232.1 uncharacterized protein LOC100278030 isoform X2 [Zea mays]